MYDSPVTLILIIATSFFSYKGFTNPALIARYCFDVNQIRTNKDYVRLISSGFLHTGWVHLVFNMIALYAFGKFLEPFFGTLQFLLVYFAGLAGGNLTALLIHKNHSSYTAIGASGAVNGLVFSGIAIAPHMGIGIFFLPVSIPGWAFGLAYTVFTIYGIKAKWGNSGHAAHLGGALVGMVLTLLLYPGAFRENYIPVLAILLPTLCFLVAVVYNPSFLLIGTIGKTKDHYSIDHDYNKKRTERQMTIDELLEKIHKKGISSLSKKEREMLEAYSKKAQ